MKQCMWKAAKSRVTGRLGKGHLVLKKRIKSWLRIFLAKAVINTWNKILI